MHDMYHFYVHSLKGMVLHNFCDLPRNYVGPDVLPKRNLICNLSKVLPFEVPRYMFLLSYFMNKNKNTATFYYFLRASVQLRMLTVRDENKSVRVALFNAPTVPYGILIVLMLFNILLSCRLWSGKAVVTRTESNFHVSPSLSDQWRQPERAKP